MIRLAALGAVALAAAGCGSAATTSTTTARHPPRLPRELAQTWAQQADAVASSLAAGDGCAAQAQVAQLQQEVVAAVNAHRIPPRLLEPLSSGVNDLAARVTCAPPPGELGNGHGRGRAKGHHKHGGEGGD